MANITVYWRPGCEFCMALMRQLNRRGLAHARVNIWQDDRTAAFVRRASGGDETVPTVQVGEDVLINPSVREVLAAVERIDPDIDLTAAPTAGRLTRLLSRWRAAGSNP